MIKYLANRRCPKCRCSFIVMLLTYNSKIRMVNGFCGKCDHSFKWQLILGNVSMYPKRRMQNQTVSPIVVASDQATKLEVKAHD